VYDVRTVLFHASHHIIDYRTQKFSCDPLFYIMEPGDQIGIRLAHHALAKATQSSLSAFHNAGLGSDVVTRMSPSLQQIMDGAIYQSNTSMIIRMGSEKAMTQRNIRYYVDSITNSFVDKSLEIEDFWYDIGREFGMIPLYEKGPRSVVFRFYMNYIRMAKDHVTLQYLCDKAFGSYVTCHSPDFMGIVDVHLGDDTHMSGVMEVLDTNVGVDGILECHAVGSDGTFVTVGSNLAHVLSIPDVDVTETISNNVYDVEKNLGVDAAREVLYEEILSKAENAETAAMLADFMTYRGYVSSFKKDNPVLKDRGFLSSIAFERPKNDIKNAIRNKLVDHTESVYSQIITGTLPGVGSGSRLFSLEDF
jgi:DNA-directed RNA polymerase subunit A"